MTSFVIKDVRVFTGEAVLETGSVIVENGIITYVGTSPPSTDLPSTSAPGATLVPGLIDAHIHADKGRVLALEQSLRFGVTTVIDMHNEPKHVKSLKKTAKERHDVSDFKSSCYAATIDQGWPAPVVTRNDKSEETITAVAGWPKLTNNGDVEKFVRQNIEDGADFIKLMHESGKGIGHEAIHPSASLQASVVEAAHKHNLLTVAHATSLQDTITVLEAGVDGLAHTFFDEPITAQVIEKYRTNKAFCIPTLTIIGSLTGEGQQLAIDLANDKRASDLLGEQEKQELRDCLNLAAPTSKVAYAYDSVRQLKAAGIDILCGSDATPPALGTAWGISLHHELDLLVNNAGLTPQEALRAATSLNARVFGLHDRGLLVEGRRADMVLVEGNPIQNINDTLNLRGIWRDGHRLAA